MHKKLSVFDVHANEVRGYAKISMILCVPKSEAFRALPHMLKKKAKAAQRKRPELFLDKNIGIDKKS